MTTNFLSINVAFFVYLFEANTLMAFHVITSESFTEIHFYYLEKTQYTVQSSESYTLISLMILITLAERVNENADARCVGFNLNVVLNNLTIVI